MYDDENYQENETDHNNISNNILVSGFNNNKDNAHFINTELENELNSIDNLSILKEAVPINTKIKGKDHFFIDDIDLDEYDQIFGVTEPSNTNNANKNVTSKPYSTYKKKKQPQIKIDKDEINRLFREYERQIEEEINRELKETYKPFENISEEDKQRARKLIENFEFIRSALDSELINYEEIVIYIDYYELLCLMEHKRNEAFVTLEKISELFKEDDTWPNLQKQLEKTLNETDLILSNKVDLKKLLYDYENAAVESKQNAKQIDNLKSLNENQDDLSESNPDTDRHNNYTGSNTYSAALSKLKVHKNSSSIPIRSSVTKKIKSNNNPQIKDPFKNTFTTKLTPNNKNNNTNTNEIENKLRGSLSSVKSNLSRTQNANANANKGNINNLQNNIQNNVQNNLQNNIQNIQNNIHHHDDAQTNNTLTQTSTTLSTKSCKPDLFDNQNKMTNLIKYRGDRREIIKANKGRSGKLSSRPDLFKFDFVNKKGIASTERSNNANNNINNNANMMINDYSTDKYSNTGTGNNNFQEEDLKAKFLDFLQMPKLLLDKDTSLEPSKKNSIRKRIEDAVNFYKKKFD